MACFHYAVTGGTPGSVEFVRQTGQTEALWALEEMRKSLENGLESLGLGPSNFESSRSCSGYVRFMEEISGTNE